MLEELRTDATVSTDRPKTRPKAQPGHVPLDEGARWAERVLEFPASMNIVNRAGLSRRECYWRQDRDCVLAGGLRRYEATG